MRSLELAQAAGISYRQLDWWVRRKWLHPTGGKGSGRQREFDEEEVAIALTAGQLLKLGFVPERAVRYARELQSSGTQSIDLDGWVLVRTASADPELAQETQTG
jgi:DNA-binding transcriptional MerR regulator